MDTESLVKKTKSGDKNSLVQLILAKKQDYYKIAYVYMKNSEDAMEDMIVVLYKNIHKLRKDSSFDSWSKTILVNCCRNSLRKKNKIIIVENLKEEAYEEGYANKEDGIILEEHLSKLPEKHREVIKLRYYLDMDYQTISEVLKVPVGTVKSRISNGFDLSSTSLKGLFKELQVQSGTGEINEEKREMKWVMSFKLYPMSSTILKKTMQY